MADSTSFFGIWLFAVASHAGSIEYWVSWSYKTRDVNGNQLYGNTVTFCPVLQRSTFSEIFSLWYNFVRSSHNALYSCTLSTDFSTPIAQRRTMDCMFVRLKSRHVWFLWTSLKSRQTSQGQVVSTAATVAHLLCFLRNATTSITTDVASESARTAEMILWSSGLQWCLRCFHPHCCLYPPLYTTSLDVTS